jgi:uridine monophosphate synthetase
LGRHSKGDPVNFFEKISEASQRNNSLLCVGLDPIEAVLPAGPDICSRLVGWGTNLISQTADYACCFKPNIAFYEQFGLEGIQALIEILQAVPPHLPVLLDAKRGDIGSSAEAYARGAFDHFHADAITLSPYLGGDSIRAFLQDAEKAVFILCQTSNPSAKEIQQHGEPPLYELIAQIAQSWGTSEQIGFVIGATQPDALHAVREACPDHWILAPGLGTQGGDLVETLQAGLRLDKMGLILPVSRSIMTAADPAQAARGIQNAVNACRTSFVPASSPSEHDQLIVDLFEKGCVKFGSFTLASGKQSPIYIDLRRVVSFPKLFRSVADVYVESLRRLNFDLVAGVPYAALPVSAVAAMKLGKPLIYPRKEVKGHGTGQQIEGAYQPGQRAILLEDVITSGGSLITAAERLRAAGLVVEDAVILVDRNQGGSAALAQSGIRAHPVLEIFEILHVLKAHNCITGETHEEVTTYLEAS